MKIVTIIFLSFGLCFANYPSWPINIVVPFAKDGSSDRTSRIIKPYLEKEFGVKVNIIDMKGDYSKKGTNYFFEQKQDGYYILASTFSPYFIANTLEEKSKIKIEDLSILNINWFDYDLIAVNNKSDIKNFSELLKILSSNKKVLKVGEIKNSTGYFIFKLLIQKLNIKKSNIKFVYYDSGNQARKALKNNEIDFMISALQGSETIRDFIRPLVIIKEKRTRTWDAPTLNQALESYFIKLPVITSLRGFAVSSKFKKDYPQRYETLLKVFEKVFAQKSLQKKLRKNNIGYIWIGAKKSKEIFEQSVKNIKQAKLLN